MDRKYNLDNMSSAFNLIADEAAVKLAQSFAGGFTEDALVTAANKGTYKRALKDIDGGEFRAEADGENIKIALSDAEVVMCADITACKCTCPSKTVCRHIISSAIMLSQFSDGNPVKEVTEATLSETVQPTEAETSSPEADVQYLNEVLDTVKKIIAKGLISCTDNDAETMERLSVTAPVVHRSISRLCRSISEDIKLMLEKSAAFDQKRAVFRLCRIYNTADVSLKEQGKKLLFTGNDYNDIGRCVFMCLGVYPYRSKTGYAGLTAVMYEIEQKKFYTYNTAIADFYSSTADAGSIKSLLKTMRAQAHWQNKVSFENICGRKITLNGCKADRNGKISSSSKTTCTISDRWFPAIIPEGAFEFAPEEEYDYFSSERTPRYAMVKSQRVGNVHFDKGNQILYYTIITDDGTVRCETAYSELSAFAVKNIEDYAKEDRERYFLLKRFGSVTQIVCEAGIGGSYNIYFGNRRELTV